MFALAPARGCHRSVAASPESPRMVTGSRDAGYKVVSAVAASMAVRRQTGAGMARQGEERRRPARSSARKARTPTGPAVDRPDGRRAARSRRRTARSTSTTRCCRNGSRQGALSSGGYPYDEPIKDKRLRGGADAAAGRAGQAAAPRQRRPACASSSCSRAATPPARAARSSPSASTSTRARRASSRCPSRPSASAASGISSATSTHLPTAGEMVLFDRSWYNRAGVEPVMGFCTPTEHRRFPRRRRPSFEKMLVDDGIVLFKFWLEIGREMQLKRFHERRHDPLKIWKLSPIDYAAMHKWDAYTEARDDDARGDPHAGRRRGRWSAPTTSGGRGSTSSATCSRRSTIPARMPMSSGARPADPRRPATCLTRPTGAARPNDERLLLPSQAVDHRSRHQRRRRPGRGLRAGAARDDPTSCGPTIRRSPRTRSTRASAPSTRRSSGSRRDLRGGVRRRGDAEQPDAVASRGRRATGGVGRWSPAAAAGSATGTTTRRAGRRDAPMTARCGRATRRRRIPCPGRGAVRPAGRRRPSTGTGIRRRRSTTSTTSRPAAGRRDRWSDRSGSGG